MIPAILLGKLKRICHKLVAGVVEGAHNMADTREAGRVWWWGGGAVL